MKRLFPYVICIIKWVSALQVYILVGGTRQLSVVSKFVSNFIISIPFFPLSYFTTILNCFWPKLGIKIAGLDRILSQRKSQCQSNESNCVYIAQLFLGNSSLYF